MSLELVTVRARTRGKSPVEFQYQGVGKLTPRKVLDADNQAIVLGADGKAVLYTFDKEGKVVSEDGITQDEKGELILAEGQRYVVLDDVDATGLTENLQDVIDLYGAAGNANPMQAVIDGGLNWFNLSQRKSASPVVETISEDELTPVIAAMVKAGTIAEENVSVWRRTVTSGAKSVEMDRLTFAAMTKEYKAAKKAGAFAA